MRQLDVYVNTSKAGVLTEETSGRGYTFLYDNDFLALSKSAISVTLPKRKEEYRSETLFPFFSNMIPEGANRRVICRQQRIDEKDLFGILMAMTDKDCIGAVNLKRHTYD